MWSDITEAIHIISYGSGMDTKDYINGRKGLDALRTCRGTWLARKSHMTKVSQCTFHKHHFKAIMGFITHGLTPRWVYVWVIWLHVLPWYSKHLPDDWLERMFHSCQHRYTTASHDIHDHPENHPMLMSHMVSVGGAQSVVGGTEFIYYRLVIVMLCCGFGLHMNRRNTVCCHGYELH